MTSTSKADGVPTASSEANVRYSSFDDAEPIPDIATTIHRSCRLLDGTSNAVEIIQSSASHCANLVHQKDETSLIIHAHGSSSRTAHSQKLGTVTIDGY
jgi:hypothetical protein